MLTLRRLLAHGARAWRFRRDRALLLEMDAHQLRDLGLYREDVRRGVPFRRERGPRPVDTRRPQALIGPAIDVEDTTP